VRVPDERTPVLVRSCQNRRLADGGSLYKQLSRQRVIGEYEIEVGANQRTGRKRRVAKLEVRFAEVEIAAPAGYQGAAKSVCLQALEAREGDAPRIIGYYQQLWRIEEVFRVLKRQGLDVE
jgi:hypothetical protein